MKLLKQSTTVTVKVGPFVDSTDGNTAETGLTISQADVRLSKNGGNMAQKNESTSCTHDELGMYDCPLDATDTNTLGILTVNVHESGALPVKQDYLVVPAVVYDSLVSGTGNGPRVDVAAVSGDSGAADNLESAYDGTGYAHTGNTYPWTAAWDAEVQSEVQDAIEANHLDHLLATTYDPAAKPGAADALLNELVESDGGVARFTANALEQAPGGGSDVFVLRDNTAQAGGPDTITLDAGASVTNNVYRLNQIFINAGTGAGQSRQIASYVGATKVATVDTAWDVQPDATSEFVIAPFGVLPASLGDIEDTIWDAQRSDHQVAGSFGERVLSDMTHVSGDAAAADNLEAAFETAPGAIAVDVQFVNGVELEGDGSDGDPWRALGT